MKLKTRIIISFFSIIFIPVILTSVMFYTGMKMKLESIGKQYGIEEPTYENLINNTLMLNKMTEADMEELRATVKENPKKMEQQEYLNTLMISLKRHILIWQ